MYYRIKQLTLLLGDLISLYLGLYFALSIRYQTWPAPDFPELLWPVGKIFLLGVIVNFIIGLYDMSRCRNSWRFFQKIILSTLIWLVLGAFYLYFSRDVSRQPKTILVLTAGLGFGVMTLWRYLHNKFLAKNILKSQILFAGYTPEVKELVELVRKNPELGYSVIGIIEHQQNLDNYDQNMWSGCIWGKSLSDIYDRTDKRAELTVVAPNFSKNPELIKELYREIFHQGGVVSLASFYENTMKRIPPFTFSEGWFIANLQEQKKKMYDRFKILIDYAVAIIIGAVFLIIHLPIAAFIKLTSKGTVFYRQERVGRQGKIFKMYKYRTMKSLGADGSAEDSGPQFAKINDQRVTSIGKFLRRTRIDEIPQFINILRGEMSIIGPRPERPEFVAELNEQLTFYNLRHLVKPGLTGWAQIHKSYYGTIQENLKKLEYDLYYLKNRGPLLDTVIILRTLATIAKMMGR